MGEEIAVDALAVWDDDHLSPVGGVDLASDESACFEPVDHSRDRTSGEAREVGEPPRGGGPVEDELLPSPTGQRYARETAAAAVIGLGAAIGLVAAWRQWWKT